MIHPISRNINQQAVFFHGDNGDSYPTRGSRDRYYILSVEIKDFNVLTDNNSFFDTMKP